MQKLLIIIFALAIFCSCRSSKKALQEGYYTEAIKKSVKVLQKEPDNQEEIGVLAEAFRRGQQKDLEKIEYLKKEGPDNWENIYSLLVNMKDKQDLVKTLPALRLKGKSVVFPFINVEDQLLEAKQKAAAYLYAKGLENLNKHDKFMSRAAYDDFQKVKHYLKNYKDVDDLILKAKEEGTSNVFFKIANISNQPLPPNFENTFIAQLQVQNFDKKWVHYFSEEIGNIRFDYTIVLKVNQIEISPERVSENRYTESKKVEDGWEYRYDAKGNVMKDAKGNDIKVTKYVEINCTVLESVQRKAARLITSVDFYEFPKKIPLKAEPLIAEAIFEHFSALPLGNINALSPESREKTRSAPVPFPSNMEIIMRASDNLNLSVKNLIRNNEYLLK